MLNFAAWGQPSSIIWPHRGRLYFSKTLMHMRIRWFCLFISLSAVASAQNINEKLVAFFSFSECKARSHP